MRSYMDFNMKLNKRMTISAVAILVSCNVLAAESVIDLRHDSMMEKLIKIVSILRIGLITNSVSLSRPVINQVVTMQMSLLMN